LGRRDERRLVFAGRNSFDAKVAFRVRGCTKDLASFPGLTREAGDEFHGFRLGLSLGVIAHFGKGAARGTCVRANEADHHFSERLAPGS
jgi:hypothetical protein